MIDRKAHRLGAWVSELRRARLGLASQFTEAECEQTIREIARQLGVDAAPFLVDQPGDGERGNG